jgi:hypothetical protein
MQVTDMPVHKIPLGEAEQLIRAFKHWYYKMLQDYDPKENKITSVKLEPTTESIPGLHSNTT